jgi:hypothetical protein
MAKIYCQGHKLKVDINLDTRNIKLLQVVLHLHLITSVKI